jgi:hypothetical protein
MSFPTEAYMAAAANAARIQADAQAQMGRSIGQGIEKIGSAIGDYKKMSSEVKSSEKFFKAMKDYLPSELTGGIDSIVGGEDYKHMSTAEKANIWGNIKSYTGGAIAQRNKMEQIGAEQQGLLDRAMAGKKPALDLGGVDTAIDSIWNPKPAQPSMQPSMGDTTQPATDLAEFLRRKGWSGTGPVPKALMREFEASQPFPNPY